MTDAAELTIPTNITEFSKAIEAKYNNNFAQALGSCEATIGVILITLRHCKAMSRDQLADEIRKIIVQSVEP